MSIKIQNMMSYTLKYDVINKRVKKRGTKTQATIEIENRMYNIKTTSLWLYVVKQKCTTLPPIKLWVLVRIINKKVYLHYDNKKNF